MIGLVAALFELVIIAGLLVEVHRTTVARQRDLGAFERDRETWRAQQRELHDRLMYLADKPWAPPPVLEPDLPPLPEAVHADWGPEAEWPS